MYFILLIKISIVFWSGFGKFSKNYSRTLRYHSILQKLIYWFWPWLNKPNRNTVRYYIQLKKQSLSCVMPPKSVIGTLFRILSFPHLIFRHNHKNTALDDKIYVKISNVIYMLSYRLTVKTTKYYCFLLTLYFSYF